MWECICCKALFSNPEQLSRHHKKESHGFDVLNDAEKRIADGWQGVELSGFPRTKDGRILWVSEAAVNTEKE